jgi:uncharacterized protein (TIGR02284 family)
MATSEGRQAVSTLNRLIRLCIASEKGFNIAAENVKNRGLQVMFKAYAQERAQFADKLRKLVRERGEETAQSGGWLAAAHRGWINIKAAMTIGQPATEKVVLGEVVRGERVALRRYEDALRQPLSAAIQDVLEEQRARVAEVSERAQELQGRGGTRLVVRLFDSESDATTAEAQLVSAGFDPERMERVPLSQVLNLYQGQHVMDTTAESGLAGALVGTVLGVLLGVVAGFSGMVAPGGSLFSMGVGETFLWTMLVGAIAGLFFGALIGAIIGLGVSQEDEYRYANSVRHGSLLLLLRVDVLRAAEATDIMKRVNAGRWRLAT